MRFLDLTNGSLNSPVCSCVSITLPASSNTRMTASCERHTIVSPLGSSVLYSLSRLKRCRIRWANGAMMIEAMPIKANPENNA